MEPVSQEEKLFKFEFSTKGAKFTMECPINIPMETSPKEYAGRLLSAHKLPCFVKEELEKKLAVFVDKETEEFYDRQAQRAIDRLQSGEIDVDSLADKWSSAFTNEVLEYTQPEAVSNELVFSEVYHTLIHSPALETLLNLEHKYSIDMGAVIENRDRELLSLEDRQQREMEEAMKGISSGVSDDYINQLAQSQFETSQLMGSKWASELSVLQESQKREYRDWVMTVHEDTQASEGTPAYVQRVRALSSSSDAERGDDPSIQPRREESFTVHLGAQLKTTHNIRLVCADVLDLCKHKSSHIGSTIVPQPQRLQTAMSLYSNSLCGLVLLVDNRLNSYTGMKRDFAKVCEQSTDFHFPTLEQQFQSIESSVEQAIQWRLQKKLDEHDNSDIASIKSFSSAGSLERDEKSLRLQPGDFYITRHSNLSEVHIVFHLVCDDTVRSSVSEISSRHPAILGYRNILKACFRYDIHTITLPLLLNHEMVEEMTIPWCLKRAELIFKCVKGFMMELVTWSDQESRTIQFLVPKTMSDDTFQQISALLPNIFRMSNPVKLAK